MAILTLKNRLTINSIIYQGTVRVSKDIAPTLRYIDNMAERKNNNGEHEKKHVFFARILYRFENT